MDQVSKTVSFRDILADDQARRVSSSMESIEALKKSIANLGLLDPMIVEALPGGKYRLCAGRNRYTAIKSLLEDDGELRFEQVPCTILEFSDHELIDENYKNYKISQVIFDSNDKRSQLTKFEQARHYAAQKQQFPHLFKNDFELAKFNNKPVNEVVEALRLLEIAQEVIDRVEELNLHSPYTIPFMCLEEIAEAAALPKRPLPFDGQMRVVELLISPDLPDKRALVQRDKMKALVNTIRREYAPDPRGRKPKSEPQDQPALSVDHTTGDNLFITESNPSARPSDQSTSDAAVLKASPSLRDESAIAPVSSVNNNSTTQSDQTIQTSMTNDVVSGSTSKMLAVPSPSVSSSTLAIVDININNAINALNRELPDLTEEQYEFRLTRIEELRHLLASAVARTA